MEFNKQNILNKVKAATQSTVVMDEGLRAYMLKVYNYMATGILLTGIIALISFKAFKTSSKLFHSLSSLCSYPNFPK